MKMQVISFAMLSALIMISGASAMTDLDSDVGVTVPETPEILAMQAALAKVDAAILADIIEADCNDVLDCVVQLVLEAYSDAWDLVWVICDGGPVKICTTVLNLVAAAIRLVFDLVDTVLDLAAETIAWIYDIVDSAYDLAENACDNAIGNFCPLVAKLQHAVAADATA